jgi:hypothetical protein
MVPPSSTPEEALTIARTKGGEGNAAQTEIDVSRENLKSKMEDYKTSRQEELMKEHKNEDDTWKDTALAHQEETEKQLAAYKTQSSSMRTARSRKGKQEGAQADVVKTDDATPTGNTRSALKGLMGDWRTAKAAGDTKGMEKAKRAHQRVMSDEGADSVQSQMCYGDNCTNEVAPEEPKIVNIKGKTLNLNKSSGDGVTCESCAAKEANNRNS